MLHRRRTKIACRNWLSIWSYKITLTKKFITELSLLTLKTNNSWINSMVWLKTWGVGGGVHLLCFTNTIVCWPLTRRFASKNCVTTSVLQCWQPRGTGRGELRACDWLKTRATFHLIQPSQKSHTHKCGATHKQIHTNPQTNFKIHTQITCECRNTFLMDWCVHWKSIFESLRAFVNLI